MVPMGYWTNSKIHALLTWAPSATANHVPEPVDEPLDEVIEEFFTTSSMYTEAVYEKPNLVVIVRRDGQHLTPKQQAQLLQVLAANDMYSKDAAESTPEEKSESHSRRMQFHSAPSHIRFI